MLIALNAALLGSATAVARSVWRQRTTISVQLLHVVSMEGALQSILAVAYLYLQAHVYASHHTLDPNAAEIHVLRQHRRVVGTVNPVHPACPSYMI